MEGDDAATAATGCDQVMLVALVLILGWFLQAAGKIIHIPIPYTGLIFFCGLLTGILDFYGDLGSISSALRVWIIGNETGHGGNSKGVDPDLFLFLFLPILIFGDLFSGDCNRFLRGTPQALILAFPGVVVSTFLFGLFGRFLCKWTFNLSCAFGAMISCTDPVAVLAIMKKCGVKRRALNLISAEAILNDGAGIILFTLYVQMIHARSMSALDVVSFITRNLLGPIGIGVGFGLVALLAIKISKRSKVLITTLTVAIPYLIYYTAQFKLNISGVLSLVIPGLIVGLGCEIFSGSELHDYIGSIWEFLEFFANSLIFYLSGVLIAEDIVLQESHLRMWLLLAITYFVSLGIRAIMVLLFFPLLKRVDPGTSPKECILVWWGGLRGAVGLALAMVLRDLPSEEKEGGQQAAFLMSGIVILTLLINSSSTNFLIRTLKLAKATPSEERILKQVRKQCEDRMHTIISFARNSNYSPLDEFRMSFRTTILGIAQDEGEILREKRFRFMLCMKRKVTILHNHLLIGDLSCHILLWVLQQHALRRAGVEMDIWSGLLANICRAHVADGYNSCSGLQKMIWRKFLTLGSEIAFGFLAGHAEARSALKGLSGGSEEILIQESLRDSSRAAYFLNYLKENAPAIIKKLKTDQVRHTCRWYSNKQILAFLANGVLEIKDRSSILESVNKSCENIRKINFDLGNNIFTPEQDNQTDLYPFGCAMLLEEEEVIVGDTKQEGEDPPHMLNVMDRSSVPNSIQQIGKLPEVELT
mmetsp:Transcript_97/g.260  ORF Transcript_97/g.260 Transcript_97/m.260 type:complete len:760 (+) Transcript_97:194-2473(+)|eukprot:CAMPEP_0182608832 /NCGR_PEP_ID=MMETSP1330-20130603/3131_1 /TAXON_ID=464278 /ORGANISM="Picochlorum sp., Strain RCC944" /LENGTH=759 /DNA_ID=CAMNT_0024827641 /DNA_START=95 /DNA_END=2374 /DNA_ORIENTATION=-